HAMNLVANADPQFCKECGHRTDVPSRDCDCPKCCQVKAAPKAPLRKKKAFFIREKPPLSCTPEWSSDNADCRRADLIFSAPDVSFSLKSLSPSELRRLARFVNALAKQVEFPLG